MYVKETYVYVKRHVYVKETYVYVKETYVYVKEIYVYAKETHSRRDIVTQKEKRYCNTKRHCHTKSWNQSGAIWSRMLHTYAPCVVAHTHSVTCVLSALQHTLQHTL